MKKVSFGFLAMELVGLFLISILASIVLSMLFMEDGDEAIMPLMVIVMSFVSMAMISIIYFCYGNGISKSIVNSTIRKHAASNNFTNCMKFEGIGATILVDEATGRVAYISSRNPFAFQVVSVRDIHNMISTYDKGPFGGTRYVYVKFHYKNQQIKVPTFASRYMASLESSQVLEAISKGDAFVESIQRTQNNMIA